jgi:molybdopterin-guanine dinucleotide biosynthesis protein A
MSTDKATLLFRGEPMVAIAVRCARAVCAAVSIAGNRDDLGVFAPVVAENRMDAGPVAGIEAAMAVCAQPWALFLPVDTPLLPADFLLGWMSEAITRPGLRASYLRTGEILHPATCLIRHDQGERITARIEAGERRIVRLLDSLGEPTEQVWVADCDPAALRNLNTPEDLAVAEEEARRS